MSEVYDIVIIDGGPGGVTAGVKAAEAGLSYVVLEKGVYVGRKVIFAFGSNIPNELGGYGEAKTVAYRIENPEDYTGITTLVIGGGNAAADIVTALSRVKREAGDPFPVYWGHIWENSRSIYSRLPVPVRYARSPRKAKDCCSYRNLSKPAGKEFMQSVAPSAPPMWRFKPTAPSRNENIPT